jgi:hypothetical protein
VAGVAHLFGDPQSGNQIRRFLRVDLVVAIGPVNLEHVRSFLLLIGIVAAMWRKWSRSN